MAVTLHKRDAIKRAMVTAIRTIATPTYCATVQTCREDELSDADLKKLPAVVVILENERAEYMPCEEVKATAIFQIAAAVQRSKPGDVMTQVSQVAAAIERCLMLNDTLGGLAIMIRTPDRYASIPDRDGYASAMIRAEVVYRYNRFSPEVSV